MYRCVWKPYTWLTAPLPDDFLKATLGSVLTSDSLLAGSVLTRRYKRRADKLRR
jgi:hypothetical protein